jgi:hypothetical protein
MPKGVFGILLKIFPKDIALEIITFVDKSEHFGLVKKLCEEIFLRVPYIIYTKSNMPNYTPLSYYPMSYYQQPHYRKESTIVMLYYNGRISRFGHSMYNSQIASGNFVNPLMRCLDYVDSNGIVSTGHSQGIKKVISCKVVCPNVLYEVQSKLDWATRVYTTDIKKKLINQIKRRAVHKDTLQSLDI